MRACLTGIPYEIVSCIVSALSVEDVISLSQTCRYLHCLVEDEQICRIVLQVSHNILGSAERLESPALLQQILRTWSCAQLLTCSQHTLPFSPEFLAAQSRGVGWASALRRISKRCQAVSTATPYSVAIVGVGDTYFYSNHILCYTLDNSLRVLDLYNSAHEEIVVDIPRLLQTAIFKKEKAIPGRFRVLYYCSSIVSCLFKPTNGDLARWLVVIDIRNFKTLLSHQLQSSTRIFVRHNENYLYYGTQSDIGLDGHKRWVLRGYHFESAEREAAWFPEKIHLRELYGADIGSSICFEMDKKYFYALSNQTTREVEEVDWTSCYHSVRFPVDSPCMDLVERTRDELMWRRQHSEGVIDDRWTKLCLNIDQSTGNLEVVETRNEYLNGRSTSQRTYYRTKVQFPEKSMDELRFPPPKTPSPTSAMLAALTNDPLAWTVTPLDNPHFLPAQRRLPRNIHQGNDEPRLVYSKMKLSYYNTSASSFMDLANDTTFLETNQTQNLRLRVGSRRSGAPAMSEDGLLQEEGFDSVTNFLTGSNEVYIDNPIRFWPPEQDPSKPHDPALEDLHTLLNPPHHLGDVEATADENSIFYMTGKKNKPRAIVLVNFDPALKVEGIQRWHGDRRIAGCQVNRENWFKEACASVGVSQDSNSKDSFGLRSVGGNGEIHEKVIKSTTEQLDDAVIDLTPNFTQSECSGDSSAVLEDEWIWKENPMYKAVQRGYDFSW